MTGLEDITAEELTTESIVAQVQYKNSDEYEDNENDDTEEAPAVCVTLSEALASVDNMRRYFQAQEGTAQFLQE